MEKDARLPPNLSVLLQRPARQAGFLRLKTAIILPRKRQIRSPQNQKTKTFVLVLANKIVGITL